MLQARRFEVSRNQARLLPLSYPEGQMQAHMTR